MTADAAKPAATCATIQGGTLLDSASNPISLGYDQWGYNYQARMFNGWYNNYSRPVDPVSSGDRLMMKWNDAWLSNKSCDSDSTLDRHLGLPSYRGSGAWLTNHASGTYMGTGDNFTWEVDGQTVMTHSYSGTDYPHDLFLTDTNGALSGYGGFPAGGSYAYAWTITSGTVTGDIVEFYADYTLGAVGTTMHVLGTIQPDGSIMGTWDDNYGGDTRSGDMNIPAGFVTKVPTTCEWSDFVKIVAVPTTAIHDPAVLTLYGEGMWYESVGGPEIGPALWGEFAVIQEVASDPCGEFNLMNYKSELRSGLGNWADKL